MFYAMDLETRERVIRDFDLLRMESGAPRIHEAFAQAVALESGLFAKYFGNHIKFPGPVGDPHVE